jgi:hypothetical protein
VTTPVRIANCSGFYGDRISALSEQLRDGPIDVITGDYLAELTMLILGKDRMKDPTLGYARTFVRQLQDTLGEVLERGVKVVVNAGGLNPAGLADAVRTLGASLGLDPKVAHVEGDDVRAHAAELGVPHALTANAYLGGFGIKAGLDAGADIVVTGRVTDAALVIGAAAWHHGWTPDDHDALAGALVAGHVIECGCQATGGNLSSFAAHDLLRPGYPIAEVAADGSSVITKHDGTGGVVNVDSVTAQLLYEVTGARYANPDVTGRLDSIELTQLGPDRVAITGVVGEAPPPELKVATNVIGGMRNEMELLLTGLDIDAKAALIKAQVTAALAEDPPAELVWTMSTTTFDDPATQERATTRLRCSVKDSDPKKVGRPFTSALVEAALASYPGFTMTAPPGPATPFGVFHPAYMPASAVDHTVVLPDGISQIIAPPSATRPLEDAAVPVPPEPLGDGPTTHGPLGDIARARSGDKGGDANIGVWVTTDEAYRWLVHLLTPDTVRALLPETAKMPVTVHALPNLRAVNIVVTGLLGEGVSSGTRIDPQGKGLGEWLRARHVDVPDVLLADPHARVPRPTLPRPTLPA